VEGMHILSCYTADMTKPSKWAHPKVSVDPPQLITRRVETEAHLAALPQAKRQ